MSKKGFWHDIKPATLMALISNLIPGNFVIALTQYFMQASANFIFQ